MRRLVTGGAGYIGSISAEALLEAGHAAVIDNTRSRGHEAAVPDGAVFLVGDSMDQPGRYLRENILGGLALVEAMVKASVHRLVYSSSSAIFGNPSRLPVEEDDPKETIGPYGESKLLLERALRLCGERHGIQFISLRTPRRGPPA